MIGSQDLPAWTGLYLGLPFADHGRSPQQGFDCWGLTLWVLREQGGAIGLPELTYRYAKANDRAVAEVFTDELRRWQRVDAPQRFDIAVFNIYGLPRHVGLVLSPEWVLMIDRATRSCLERLQGSRWASRLEGYYRWVNANG